ncbi:MAG: sigma-54-dependent transcriptional regulator [Terriglobales bacterium]
MKPLKPGAELFVQAVSPSMRAVEMVIHELAHSDVPVLLLGEAGVGKRTIARRIHENSGEGTGQFRVFNCADLTGELLQELDSQSNSNLGTVFLEEIADLHAPFQTRLLEVLSGFGKGGATMPRLICGSSRDLGTEVREGRVREDLYYRISGVCLRLPPLRQRKEDIPALTNLFLAKYATDFSCPIPTVSVQTQCLFNEYAWPGNIPELADAVKALVALGNESLAMRGLRAMLTKSDHAIEGPTVSLKSVARAASREAERELILKALTRTRWNRRRAAEELQISYKALLYKLKQIGYSEYEAS